MLRKHEHNLQIANRADLTAGSMDWEREIDERIYRLYGLTDEEIKIVEKSVRR